MPEADRLPTSTLRGPLARLDRSREELAKAWLMRLIERASLDEISELPTDRLAAELPALISDILHAAASGEEDPFALSDEARDRAGRLADLRKGHDSTASELTRDVAAIQSVVLEALAQDADELGGAGYAAVAGSITEAIAGLQAAAVDTLVDQRSRELETLANTDPLTGLANMRHLQTLLRQSLALLKRYEQPFALLVLDVDGLKRVNDGQGHQAGDRVLVQVALAMRRTLRSVDTPVRIGGDEFCVLAPAQTSEAARPLAERLAVAVESETAGAEGERGMGISIGVVSAPEHGDEADVLLDRGDQAMYRAKAAGDAVAMGEPGEAPAQANGNNS